MNIRGPFIVKKGQLELVCFYENEDLLLLFPVQRYLTGHPILWQMDSPLFVGDVVEVPGGERQITQIEVIPPLDINRLNDEVQEQLQKEHWIFTHRVIWGFKYKLDYPREKEVNGEMPIKAYSESEITEVSPSGKYIRVGGGDWVEAEKYEVEEILAMLKGYFKDLALDWQSDNICQIDDRIDLERLANYIFRKGKGKP